MRAIVLAGCVAVLAACAGAPREDEDPFHLHIAIGRWNVMVSQVADIQQIAQPDYIADDELLEARTLARRLREAVWFYNLERLQLCARERLVEASCGPPYLPGWLNEAPEEGPSFRALARRSEDVGERITPFWNAVCAQARAGAGDEAARRAICPME